eukprot:jgi/Botrbrau1/3300/Bobra.174_1s0062.1
MAVTAIATAAPCLATRKTVVARKAISGVAVPHVNRRIVARVNKGVVASSEERKQMIELPAAVTVAIGTAMASPLAAQAGVTPSLKNLINSVIAGGVVLGLIFGAVTLVAGFDPVKRN